MSTGRDRRDSRRRVLRWSPLPYALLTAGIVVLAAVLYLIVEDLGRDNRRIQADYRDNLLWIAGQFEHELSAFVAAFDSYYLGEPSMTRNELIDRFDVFWSRVEGADKGAVGKIYMGFEGAAPLIEKTKRLLREIEPIVMTMQSGDTVSHLLIKARLEDLPASFHDVALLTFHEQMRNMSANHRRVEEAHGKLLAIFAGVLAGGAILIGLILLEMRRVKERTSELHAAQGDLLRQERLATLGRLTATVGHELRNPLATIRASNFIVSDNIQDGNPRIGRALERIERNVIRCNRIIDELLDFTRISDIEAEPTPIDVWLEETLNEQTLPSGVALRYDFGLKDMTVSLDPDRFRRAVINVFDNACQAMIGEGREDTGSLERFQ